MNLEIVRTRLIPKISEIEFNESKGKDLLTWWYVALIKGSHQHHQPRVLISFRVLGPNNELTPNFVHKLIALTHLSQFNIGTIWRDGICRQQIKLDVETFQLDFDVDGWRYNSEFENGARGNPPLISNEAYELPPSYNYDKTWLLQFKLSNDPVGLLVPCLEFFTRCYGRSKHVHRVLATYPWEVAKSKLLAPLVELAVPGTWPVNLRKRTVNGDVVFLAHLEYDNYARRQAKKIWADLEAAQKTSGTDRVFTQVGPWFRGPARLKVKGIWLNGRKSFLALHILGGSEPEGVPIYRDRENTNKTGPLPGAVKNGGKWDGVPPRIILPTNEIVNATSSEVPDYGSSSTEVEDPDYELLGTPRFVKDIYRSTTNVNGPKTRSDPIKPDKFSGDEKSGTGKDVGYASFSSSTVMESRGVLRDVWNMLKFLEKHHPDIIRKVEYLTSDGKFSDDLDPKFLPGFMPFTPEELESEKILEPYWPYEDRKKGNIRGALLARVETSVGYIYLFEIQRRFRIIQKGSEKEQPIEETFKGLVFTLTKQANIVEWTLFLLNRLRYSSGVFKEFAFSGPATAFALNHRRANAEKLPQEWFVKRVLSTMGIEIPEDPASVRLAVSDA